MGLVQRDWCPDTRGNHRDVLTGRTPCEREAPTEEPGEAWNRLAPTLRRNHAADTVALDF